MDDTLNQIFEHRFFEGFPRQLFRGLTTCAQPVDYAVDARIYREGDAAEAFFLLQTGRVALELHAGHRGTLIVQTLGAGEVLGWSWLFAPYRRRFDARAVTSVTAIAFQTECLRRLCDRNHHLGYEFYRRFSLAMLASLQATRFQLLDLYGRGDHLPGGSARRP